MKLLFEVGLDLLLRLALGFVWRSVSTAFLHALSTVLIEAKIWIKAVVLLITVNHLFLLLQHNGARVDELVLFEQSVLLVLELKQGRVNVTLV